MIPPRFLCFMCLGLTANPHESMRIPTNPYESVPKTCANPSRIRKLDHMSSVFVNSVRCPDIAYSRALFYYPTDLHHGLCTPLPPMWFGFGAHTERSIASVGSCQGFCFPHCHCRCVWSSRPDSTRAIGQVGGTRAGGSQAGGAHAEVSKSDKFLNDSGRGAKCNIWESDRKSNYLAHCTVGEVMLFRSK